MLLANLILSTFMLAVIWFVQIVHYPLFRKVSGSNQYYHLYHQKLTGLLLAPIMILEVLVAGLVVIMLKSAFWPLLSLFCLLLLWGSTFFIQVPLHQKLLDEGDQRQQGVIVERLIRSNWLRTFLWTVKFGIALILISHN